MMAKADKLGFRFDSPEQCGDIAVDEMSIQVTVTFFIHMEIVGLVDVGYEELVLRTLLSGWLFVLVFCVPYE